MPFVYIGRTNTFYGKTLWELVASLKNFGVGRYVVRSKFERYPEPSFYKIIRAEPDMNEGLTSGSVWVKKVFRGLDYGECPISRVGYKYDFKLVHKHEESKYLEAFEKYQLEHIRIFPRTVDMPPLMKIHTEKRGLPTKLNIEMHPNPRVRIAEEGETPNTKFEIGLSVPANPALYASVYAKTDAR